MQDNFICTCIRYQLQLCQIIHTWSLYITQMYDLKVLEFLYTKWVLLDSFQGVGKAAFLLEFSETIDLLAFPVCRDSLHSLVHSQFPFSKPVTTI